MTAPYPAVSSRSAVSIATKSVAISASQYPTNGARVASSPARTAIPLPGCRQRSSPTGTGPADQLRTMWLVASVLALSTTRMAVRNGSVAAFRHSAASPSGSLSASLRAGTTISNDASPVAGCVVATARRRRQRVPY